MNDLTGRTMVMSGGSRGIGLEIARSFARRGGSVALLAKTDQPHPRLPGTIHTAVDELRAAGGQAIGVLGDVREEADVARLIDTAVAEFGGIDVVVNNASAIHTAGTLDTPNKRFGLMHEVNVRGTWLLTSTALPQVIVRKGRVLTLSPPLNVSPRWLGAHPAYTMSKYAMTMLTLGWAEEFADTGISAFCLWPETLIDTAAVRNIVGGADRARSPQIVADAAEILLDRPAAETTGQVFIDAEVLASAGITDLSGYGGPDPIRDIFLD